MRVHCSYRGDGSSVERPAATVVLRGLGIALVADESTCDERIDEFLRFEIRAAKLVDDGIAQRRPTVEISPGPRSGETRTQRPQKLGQIDVFNR